MTEQAKVVVSQGTVICVALHVLAINRIKVGNRINLTLNA